MPKVNTTIQNILAEKDAGISTGIEEMRAIIEELQRQVTYELGQAALGSWDAYQLKEMLNALDRARMTFEHSAKNEMSSLLDDMWANGKALVDDPLRLSGLYNGLSLSTSSLKVLKDFAMHKISGLSDDAWQRIRGELTLGVLGGKSPQEVARAVGSNLDDQSIFGSIAQRAEVITQTEMGRVFSMAAQERMVEASDYVNGLEKQWIHAGHPKVARLNHLALHGVHIPVKERFLVGNIGMMFPRDPKAPVSEIIRCGCAHVPFHPSWGNDSWPNG